jgi:Dicarboxylate transport
MAARQGKSDDIPANRSVCPPSFPSTAVSLRCFIRILSCSLCLLVSGRADERPAWLVVGPWDARIEGRLGGPEAKVRAVVTKLRVTLDLDQPLPLAGGAAATAGRGEATGGASMPAIDFPPIIESVRVEGGELVLRAGGQTRTFSWRGEFSQASPGVWAGTLAATGAGTELTATINYRAAERTWRVPALAVRLDLAAWSALVLPEFLPNDMAWTCGGTASLEGALTWTQGGLDGTMALTLRDGRAGSVDGGISVEGIEGGIQLMSLTKLASAPGQRFTVRAVIAGQLRLTNLAAELTIFAPDRVAARMDAQGFGGRLAVEPFEFNPVAPKLAISVRADEIEAQPVLALFPDAPQGKGTLVGRLPLNFAGGRLGFGEGRLALKPGTTGRVRFHHPGLFTQAWSAWLPGRAQLGQLEAGHEELLVNELSIAVHPPGAPAGHAAEIRLVGVPADHPRKGPYTFEFNINAPLEGFINLGMKQDLHVGFR